MPVNNSIQQVSNTSAEISNVVAATNSAMQSSTVASASAKEVNPFSLLDLFLQSDIIVQLTMVLLLIASIISWSIIFEKYSTFKLLNRRLRIFEEDFWRGDDLKELLYRTKNRHVMRNILSLTLSEFESIQNSKKGHNTFDVSELEITKERLHNIMQIEGLKTFEAMERKVPILATIGSSSPFIGLFGTVWGIMNSFQSIALAKNTTLAVVAPGIAEALLATAFGLITAIPAVMFYNKFMSEINKFGIRVECFQLELSNILLRALGK